MKRQHRLATWLGAVLGTLCALLLAAQAHGADRGRLSEEFHQTYTVGPDSRVSLENINGAVHITAWDRNEVKVDAVKRANSQTRLDEAKIRVDAGADSVSIRTEYPGHDHTFNHPDDEDNPASVEYTLMVPRNVQLDEIKLINGPLDIGGVTGEVRASCINGRLTARGLAGRVRLSTINSHIEAEFDRLSNDSPIELSSVNGPVQLTLPSDAKAEMEASTVHGAISNDFGLHVHNHQPVGHNLRVELGGGGTRIKLGNVNGTIEVRHASDGRTLSPAKDLDRQNSDDDEI
jgi:hypothetical protein